MAQRTGALAPDQGCCLQPASTTEIHRRLAPNVICLFAQECEPVARQRWRGLRRGNVVSIRSRPRLMPGDLAQIWSRGSNFGKLVRLKGFTRAKDMPPGVWWDVEAVNDSLNLSDVETGERTGTGKCGVSLDKHLRRVSNQLLP